MSRIIIKPIKLIIETTTYEINFDREKLNFGWYLTISDPILLGAFVAAL